MTSRHYSEFTPYLYFSIPSGIKKELHLPVPLLKLVGLFQVLANKLENMWLNSAKVFHCWWERAALGLLPSLTVQEILYSMVQSQDGEASISLGSLSYHMRAAAPKPPGAAELWELSYWVFGVLYYHSMPNITSPCLIYRENKCFHSSHLMPLSLLLLNTFS